MSDRRAGIRVALIGFGEAGRQFHAPLISSTPGFTLAVIGSSQGVGAGSAYPGAVVAPDWFAAARRPDVDLVVIATPNDTHAPLAEAALRAGKHVVVDKPFTVTLRRGARARRHGRVGRARALRVPESSMGQRLSGNRQGARRGSDRRSRRIQVGDQSLSSADSRPLEGARWPGSGPLVRPRPASRGSGTGSVRPP